MKLYFLYIFKKMKITKKGRIVLKLSLIKITKNRISSNWRGWCFWHSGTWRRPAQHPCIRPWRMAASTGTQWWKVSSSPKRLLHRLWISWWHLMFWFRKTDMGSHRCHRCWYGSQWGPEGLRTLHRTWGVGEGQRSRVVRTFGVARTSEAVRTFSKPD